MGKSAPSTPAAPDPVATANAQGAVNRETAISNATMSHTDQTSPYGSQTWALNTSTPGGKAWSDYQTSYSDWAANTDPNKGEAPAMPGKGIDPQWSLTTTLDPAQQGMLDSSNRLGQSALNIGEAQLGRVSDTLSSPLSAAGLGERKTTLPDLSAGMRTGIKPGGEIIGTVGMPNIGLMASAAPTSGGIKYDPGYSGVESLAGQAGDIQRNVDFSGLSSLPTNGDYSTDRQRVEDSLYGRQASRLDPQFTKAETDIKTDLTNRGIPEGSDAWNNAMESFNRSKTDAYDAARSSAIAAGGSEQSRMFADSLAGRQQGYTETMGAGNFANSAQAQSYGQLSTDRNRYTSEMDRLLSSNNTAQAQEFGQNLSNAQLNNTAQQQEYAQAADRTRIANEAQAQRYGQNANDAAFNNTALGQIGQQQLTAANFANSSRDAALNERAQLRNAPLQELAGLMGMGGVQTPTFGQVQTPQQAAPDLMGATYASYNGQVNAANAANANSTSMMNGLMGLGGSLGGAWIRSDRRVKRDIKRIGTADNGLPIYSYRYVWGGPTQIGVMAQDVERVNPAAVAEFGGIKAVDYGRAFEG